MELRVALRLGPGVLAAGGKPWSLRMKSTVSGVTVSGACRALRVRAIQSFPPRVKTAKETLLGRLVACHRAG